jgi:molybdate transport system ATP-binding protein
LFPHRSVAGNLRYGERRAGARAASTGYDEIVDLLGLGALLDRRPHQLSGGERQRVAIGRALLARPRLLLLDEPLASIDRARRQEVLPYLERLRDRFRIPIVYVSHQFEEVMRLATHVVLIDGGRVVAHGGVADVSRDPALRALFGADAAGAVVDGEVECVDAGVAQVRIGAGRIAVPADRARAGWRVRVQVRADEVVLATEAPRGVAQANLLEGAIAGRVPDGPGSELVEVDVGGPRLLARVSAPRAAELGLDPGRRVWLVISAAHVRGGFPGDASS